MYSNDNNDNNNISNWTNDEVDYMQEQQRKQNVTINEQMLTIGELEAKVRTMENNARVLESIIETKTNEMQAQAHLIQALRLDVDGMVVKHNELVRQRDAARADARKEESERINATNTVIGLDDRIVGLSRALEAAQDQVDVWRAEALESRRTTRNNEDKIASLAAEHDRVVAMWKQSEAKIGEHHATINTLNMDNVSKDEQIAALEEKVKYLRRVEMRFDALRENAQSINGPLVEYGDEGEVEAQKPKRKVKINFNTDDEEFDVEDDEDTDDAIARIIEELKGRLDEADADVIKEYDDEARRDALARHSIVELMTYVIDNDIDMLGHEFNSAALFKYDLIDAIVIDETGDDDE